MSQVSIMIAEDEPLMRERLQQQLARCWPDATVVALAEDGLSALQAFIDHEPDIVFLDIRMPGMNGIDLARRIGAGAHIIFVTAYNQYAVEAFDAGAVDYLLKPVEEERLERAIERVRRKLHQPPADLSPLLATLRSVMPQPIELASTKLQWIKATVGRQIRLIHVNDVLFFQSDSKYTRVVTRDEEAFIRTPLKELLAGLDPEQFWQIHRGTVVQVKSIASAERIDAERMEVRMKGSLEKLVVSRAFTHLFRE
ncbi:LytTR family DNA-binding domain-containing protein [Burkholderiaceae bacterium DAT-1]|nr:LytTR family DNA-binding domain-containing protein [Burkholderiaceae bacterium DAT-1]